MKENEIKKRLGMEVIKYIKPNSIIGIGSGSTVSYFIKELVKIKHYIISTVSSSYKSSYQLNQLNIPVVDISLVENIDIYIDSADEIDNNMFMIKGGGAALTNEKIISSISRKFVCIVSNNKLVKKLGYFPVPVEIIPFSYPLIINKIKKCVGGIPILRSNVITDHNNLIVDIYELDLSNAKLIENKLNSIPGIVTVGLFTQRIADVVLVGNYDGSITRFS
ncbi:MAG: ribose-5-phosphate isomerase RpiA [Candidatus Lightella neohaematopini]|nr:ribose-5-phosphate isomerase RpiA [Candidatus Lightella neohaematopini]MCV2531374.1 ribose-5-phosphate isomerase RpiA [Candidatus Lightella neohaematopini]